MVGTRCPASPDWTSSQLLVLVLSCGIRLPAKGPLSAIALCGIQDCSWERAVNVLKSVAWNLNFRCAVLQDGLLTAGLRLCVGLRCWLRPWCCCVLALSCQQCFPWDNNVTYYAWKALVLSHVSLCWKLLKRSCFLQSIKVEMEGESVWIFIGHCACDLCLKDPSE